MNELGLTIAGQTILGSVIVIAIVAKLKVWFNTEGWVNTLLALVIGTALGGISYLIGLYVGWWVVPIQALWPLLLQGFISGLIASGGYKAIKTLKNGY